MPFLLAWFSRCCAQDINSLCNWLNKWPTSYNQLINKGWAAWALPWSLLEEGSPVPCKINPSYTNLCGIQAPTDQYVLVHISPAISRQDRMEMREQYCHLMLMFCKPWRQASDLQIPVKSWLNPLLIYAPQSLWPWWTICKFCMSVEVAEMIISLVDVLMVKIILIGFFKIL